MNQIKYFSEHEEYRKKLRMFLNEQINPYIDEWESTGQIPNHVWKEMGRMGLLCPSVSKKYGGLGGDFRYSVIIAEETARSNQWGLTANHHSDISELYIEKYATDEVKTKYLKDCVSGRIITGMAVTEPGAGSDLYGIKTTAKEIDEKIIINGSKTFISNAFCADLFIIAARDITNETDTEEFALFLVPSDAQGFKRGSKFKKLGWKSQDTGELFFDNCIIPSSYRIGRADQGINIFFENILSERLILAITAITLSEWVLEETLKIDVNDECEQFQLIELITEVKIGRTYVNELIKMHINHSEIMAEVNMFKCWATDLINKVVSICLDISEVYGDGQKKLYRTFKDARVIKITGGSNETLKSALIDIMNLNSLANREHLDIFQSSIKAIDQDSDRACSTKYWENQFSFLQSDNKSNEVENYAYGEKKIKLEGDLFAAVAELAEDYQVSSKIIIITLFYFLLSRYSEQNNVVIGEKQNNNYLPIIINNKKFNNINHVKDSLAVINEIYENATLNMLPFSELNDLSKGNLENVLSTLITFNEELGSELSFKFGAEIYIYKDSIDIKLVYNNSVFDNDSIMKFTGHLQSIISKIKSKEGMDIFSIPILTVSEEKQLDGFQSGIATPISEKCLFHYIEKYAEISPNSIAVEFYENVLTYKELNCKANQLGNYLISIGINSNMCIGIGMSRSTEMLISMIAIWKIGCHYVMIDPKAPLQRTSYVIENSNIELVLTNNEILGVSSKAKCFSLKDNKSYLNNKPDTNIIKDVNLDDYAYIIYTSGTTGVPNGIRIKHKGLINLAMAQSRIFRIDKDSKVLQFASIIFDAAISEIAMAFVKGATLVLKNNDDIMPGLNLSKTLNKDEITHLTISPSAFAVQPLEEFTNLSNLIFASELCTQEVVDKWKTNRHIYNAYGPSECSVCATIKDFSSSDTVTIGSPIDNVSVYILDKNMNRTPVGVTGEICISGIGVGEYINSEELNKKKFVPNPYCNVEPILYRTGDLGYWETSGEICFIGRKDFQIKLRGYRIELGEIESVLSKHKDILTSTTIVRKDMGAEDKLVSYIITSNKLLKDLDIFEYLNKYLPKYMIPNYIVFLEELPRTVVGKIDRSLLPKPELIAIEDMLFQDNRVIKIIKDLTGWENISPEHKIRDLGFNSLLTVRLVTKIKEQLNVSVPIIEILPDTQVKYISFLVNNSVQNETKKRMPEIKKVSR